jgi:hypothetical protein
MAATIGSLEYSYHDESYRPKWLSQRARFDSVGR